MKTHYVYKITNNITDMYYIGVRTSTGNPTDDIGYKYFSSSSNKEFMLDQKANRVNYVYEVLSTYSTREEANLAESNLLKHHSHLDECLNLHFNLFSLYGYVTAKKEGDEKYKLVSIEEYHTNKHIYSITTTGKVPVMGSKGKYELIDSEEYHKNKDSYVTVNKGMVCAMNSQTNRYEYISTTTLKEKAHIYKVHREGKVCVVNKETKENIIISVDEYHNNKDTYEMHNSNKVVVRYRNQEEQNHFVVSVDEYYNNKDKYESITEGKSNVYCMLSKKDIVVNIEDRDFDIHLSRGSKLFKIYDAQGFIKYLIFGRIKSSYKKTKIPLRVLQDSFRNNTPITIDNYEGWFVVREDIDYDKIVRDNHTNTFIAY